MMLSFVASLPESQNLNQRLWGNEERIDTRLDKEIWDWIDWALGWRNADIVYYIQINKDVSLVDFGWSYLYRRDHYSRWRSCGGHSPHTINIHSWIRGRLCHSSKPHSAKALPPNGTETVGVLCVALRMSTAHITQDFFHLLFLFLLQRQAKHDD